MIKAIIFDLGGVLFTNGTKSMAKHISTKYRLDFEKVYFAFNSSDYGNAFREGKISKDTFYEYLKKDLQINEDADVIERKWIDFYKLIEETRETIDILKKQYKIFFLSDNTKERVNGIDKKYDFLKWFHGGIFSHEAGVRKPNVRIYEIALERLRLKAEEVLFVDDKEINLPPAERIGMQTLLFKDPKQLAQELKKMKLL